MAGPDNDLGFMVDDPELTDELTGKLMSVADGIVVGRTSFPEMREDLERRRVDAAF
jgi:hypothetical protein